MARLYALRTSAATIAEHFGVDVPAGLMVPSELVEGLQGPVVFEAGGQRRLRMMTWGFPRQTKEMRDRGEPPGRIGLVADLTNALWNSVVVDPRYRCLIPLTHFANPDGVPGSKTRTWFSIEGKPLVAWAGFCRKVSEGGLAYAGMTMAANESVFPTNERMPVLLSEEDFGRWLHGSIEDVINFQFRAPIDASRMVIETTSQRWRGGGSHADRQPSML